MANNEKIGAKSDGKNQESKNIVTKTVGFFNKYQNIIYGVLIGLLVLIFAIIATNRFYFQPKNQKGSAAILVPIQYYNQAVQANDTTAFMLALEGDDENDGFTTIISSYKMTKIANTACYFAGLSYLHMGEKDDALSYFLKFKKKDNIYWYACQMLIGDIYDEQGNDTKAIKYYKKAIKGEDPYYTPIALFKLGQMYERIDKWNDAYKYYSMIEKDYYSQYESMGVDRFLERAKIKAGK